MAVNDFPKSDRVLSNDGSKVSRLQGRIAPEIRVKISAEKFVFLSGISYLYATSANSLSLSFLRRIWLN
jgi:hypothetical protein